MSQTEASPRFIDRGIEVLDPRPDDVLDREAAAAARPVVPGVRVDFGPDPAPFGHAPGLDGLRGLAVAIVLLYHAHFGFAIGGFLGVSVFFTLSGYLITSLLLRERARDGAISLRGFWSRRFRRLLPAALATQGFVLVLAAAGVWDGDQLRALREDVPAALGQVVNLSFILRGTSYVGNTTAPSPLNHYWSLSLEEQFYVLFPLVVAAALLLGRSRRRVLVGVLVVGIGLSALASARFGAGNVDRAYFGLDTRLAELLVGALLACATLYRVQLVHAWQRALAAVVGVAGLGGLAWLTATATVSSTWLYPGGLLLTAGCSAAVIFAAVQPGVVSSALSVGPLVWAGRVSYGLYLYHWPVFLWLTPRRTGWDQWPLFGVRMAVTVALALVSYHLLEQPICTRRFLTGWRPMAIAPAAMAALVVALLVTTSDLPARDVSLDRSSSASASGAAPIPPPPPPPQRVLVVGDEVAASIVPDPVAAAERAGIDVRVVAVPGCGVSVGGSRLVSGQAPEVANPPVCDSAPTQWSEAAAQFLPDVVVVAAGAWDVTDRQFWSEDPVRRPGDQTFDDFLRTEIATRVDELSAHGATVVWLTMPHVRRALPGVAFPAESLPENDPARIDRYNAVVNELAASTPSMEVVDLAAWTAARPGGEFSPTDRPDGVTFSVATAAELIDWTAAQIAGTVRTVDTRPAEAAAMTDPASDASLPPAPQLPPRVLPGPGEPARIMLVGDSVAFGYAFGLADWAGRGSAAVVDNKGQFNCPLARGGSYRFEQDVAEFPDRCDWAAEYTTWLAEGRPHEVVLSTGVWDVVDRILPGDRKWRQLGDATSDTYFLRELLTAIDLLSSQGARVVLLTHHRIDVGANKGFTGLPESDPARIDRLNELIGTAHGLRPDVTSVVDLAGWVASQPGGELDPGKLKDGLHYTDEYLVQIGSWLGPELLAQLK